MGLLGRYNHAPNPRLQSPVGCSGSQNTAGRQAIWGRRIGLCLCSSHCHPARQCLKKAHFGRGALLRCQKRERKAHFLLRGAPKTRLQGAPNSQHGSPRRLLSTRRRLSTLDFRLTALPLSTSTPSRLSKLAIRLPLVWTARPRVRLWP